MRDLAEQVAGLGGRAVSTYGLTETCGGIAYEGELFEGTPGADKRRRERRATRTHPDGRISARPRGDGGGVHARRLAPHRRCGRAGSGRPTSDRRRSDEAIRTGAETVWPQEVEEALRGHPKVADVAVAGRPHPEWGQQVVAFVVPASADDPPSLEELRARAAERIARFKSPGELVLVSGILAPRRARSVARRCRADDGWTMGKPKARAREGWARASDRGGTSQGVGRSHAAAPLPGVRKESFGVSTRIG